MAIQEITAAVTAKQAAELYGLKFDRRGKAVCPWHDDSHPSLSFKGTRCKCFACNNGGDAVDLTAQLFKITPMEAAKKLQEDFGIVSSGGSIDLRKLKREQRAREMLKESQRRKYVRLCEYEANSREALKAFDPETAWDIPKFRALLRAFALAQDTLNGWKT